MCYFNSLVRLYNGVNNTNEEIKLFKTYTRDENIEYWEKQVLLYESKVIVAKAKLDYFKSENYRDEYIGD